MLQGKKVTTTERNTACNTGYTSCRDQNKLKVQGSPEKAVKVDMESSPNSCTLHTFTVSGIKMVSGKKSRIFPLCIILALISIAGCGIFSGSRFGLSQEDYNFVAKETIGGKLDYTNTLDSTQTYSFGDRQYNHRQMALLMWGSSVRKMGIRNRHDAINLYEEISGAKLNAEDRKALLAGFEK